MLYLYRTIPQRTRERPWGSATDLGSHRTIVHIGSMTCYKVMEVNVSILFSSGLRTASYRKHWPTLVTAYGQTCYYCNEFATCIDHIIPVSYGGSNELENLVLSCSLCNLLAGDKVFSNIDEKQSYILIARAKNRKVTRSLCTECLLPYEYLVLSPSLFLCAECYDSDEGHLEYSQRRSWIQWIKILNIAGIPTEAHRTLRKYVFKSRQQKLITLVQLAYYGEQ